LARLTDQALLVEVARRGDAPLIRQAAVARVADQAVLADFARTDTDAGLRTAALARLTDQALLVEVARRGEAPLIRQAAVARVADQAVLAEFAKTDTDAGVRTAAGVRLTAIRRLATARLHDQIILLGLAKEDPDEGVSRLAVERITNAAALAQIAQTATDWATRTMAIERVNDQDILAQVAKTDADWSVRKTAIALLSDRQILEHVAKNDVDATLRQVASAKLEYGLRTRSAGVGRATKASFGIVTGMGLGATGFENWGDHDPKKLRELLQCRFAVVFVEPRHLRGPAWFQLDSLTRDMIDSFLQPAHKLTWDVAVARLDLSNLLRDCVDIAWNQVRHRLELADFSRRLVSTSSLARQCITAEIDDSLGLTVGMASSSDQLSESSLDILSTKLCQLWHERVARYLEEFGIDGTNPAMYLLEDGAVVHRVNMETEPRVFEAHRYRLKTRLYGKQTVQYSTVTRVTEVLELVKALNIAQLMHLAEEQFECETSTFRIRVRKTTEWKTKGQLLLDCTLLGGQVKIGDTFRISRTGRIGTVLDVVSMADVVSAVREAGGAVTGAGAQPILHSDLTLRVSDLPAKEVQPEDEILPSW
jgi:hypothetical protein